MTASCADGRRTVGGPVCTAGSLRGARGSVRSIRMKGGGGLRTAPGLWHGWGTFQQPVLVFPSLSVLHLLQAPVCCVLKRKKEGKQEKEGRKAGRKEGRQAGQCLGVRNREGKSTILPNYSYAVPSAVPPLVARGGFHSLGVPLFPLELGVGGMLKPFIGSGGSRLVASLPSPTHGDCMVVGALKPHDGNAAGQGHAIPGWLF